MTEEGPVAILPKETSRLPREKKIPEPKSETKWEKFAKEKGIKKKKKERMVWNEQTQQFAPAWGYKRVAGGGIEEAGYVEIKPGDDPFADPFTQARDDRKQKKMKNLTQQVRNQELKGFKKKKQLMEYGKFFLI